MLGGKGKWLLIPVAGLLAVGVGLLVLYIQSPQVSGVVTDIAGEPIAGASIQAGWRKTETDSQGRFSLRIPPFQEAVTASFNGEASEIEVAGVSEEQDVAELPSEITPQTLADIFGDPSPEGPVTQEDLNQVLAEVNQGVVPPTSGVITIPLDQHPIDLPPPVSEESFITNEEGLEVVQGELLVGWNEGVNEAEQIALVTQAGGRVRFHSPDTRTTIVYVSDQTQVSAVQAALQSFPQVSGVLQNYRWEEDTAPNDPDYEDYNKSWWLRREDAEPAWAMSTGRPTTYVAVIDVGFETDHADLQGAFTGYRANYTDQPFDTKSKHGTHVSGIIAARKNNRLGLSGIAPGVRLVPFKINDIARLSSIYQVLAHTKSVRIASMSMGWGWGRKNKARVQAGLPPLSLAYMQTTSATLDTILRPSFELYYKSGGVMVKSAGNDYGMDAKYNGLNWPEVIVVGATDSSGNLTPFSNVGASVDVVAPGKNIWSTVNNNSYAYLSGTSMATPLVAGTAALIRSLRPTYSPGTIQLILRKASVPADQSPSGYKEIHTWRALLRSVSLFGVKGSVSGESIFGIQGAQISSRPSASSTPVSTDLIGNFVIPYLPRASYVLTAKKDKAEDTQSIQSPALSGDEILDGVSFELKGVKEEEDINAELNENAKGNVNDGEAGGENTNAGTDSTDSAEGYTLPNGIQVSAEGCATGGFEIPPNEDGQCSAGFYFSRETIACEQIACPAGVGRNYTLECKCPEGTSSVYACGLGLVVACVSAN